MADDAPIKRKELERALRHLNMSDVDVRDALVQLAARVVALTEELDRRGDGTLYAAVDAAVPTTLARLQAVDASMPARVVLDPPGDKYAVTPAAPPCDELLPICQARCCQVFHVALSTQDLDEGVIRWDYGRPYRLRKRADSYCVHNDPATHACTAHANRPRACRTYDCRDDKRIWADFENRVLATGPSWREPRPFDLAERVREKAVAYTMEDIAVKGGDAD